MKWHHKFNVADIHGRKKSSDKAANKTVLLQLIKLCNCLCCRVGRNLIAVAQEEMCLPSREEGNNVCILGLSFYLPEKC